MLEGESISFFIDCEVLKEGTSIITRAQILDTIKERLYPEESFNKLMGLNTANHIEISS